MAIPDWSEPGKVRAPHWSTSTSPSLSPLPSDVHRRRGHFRDRAFALLRRLEGDTGERGREDGEGEGGGGGVELFPRCNKKETISLSVSVIAVVLVVLPLALLS